MTDQAKAAEEQQDATIENLDGIFEVDIINSEQETASTPEPASNDDENKGETKPDETQTPDNKKPENEGAEGKDNKSEPPSDKEKLVPLSALTDERRKRQELEEKFSKYEDKSSQEQIPDPTEDPEGYTAFMSDKQAQESLKTKINLSRSIMMTLDGFKDDYESMEQHFVEMAKTNPMLAAQMNASDNPAKFAYETAKEDLEVQKLRDPKYRETLEEEIRKKVLADLGKSSEENPASKPEKTSAVEMPNLTNAAATGSNTSPKVQEVTDVNEVFDE